MTKRLFAVAVIAGCLIALVMIGYDVAFAQTVIGQTPTDPAVVTVAAPTPYTFSAGTLVASFVNWLYVAFGGLATTMLTLWIVKVMNKLGIETTNQQRELLQTTIANGLNDAAAKAKTSADGKFTVQVQNQIVADAIKYAQDNAGQTITALGLDPKSGQAVAAIKARIETAIVDPTTPTNPALTPGITTGTAPAAAKV
jgi:hypothetical protein